MIEKETIEDESKKWERLSIMFDALSHPNRIYLLEKIGTRTIKDLADDLHVSPPALQRHVNKLSTTHLIEKEGNIYRLTSIGREIQKQLQAFENIVSKLVRIEKEQVMNNVSKVFEAPISADEMDEILNKMKKKAKEK